MSIQEILEGLRTRQIRDGLTHVPTAQDAEAFKRFCACFGTLAYNDVLAAYDENLRVMNYTNDLIMQADEEEGGEILRVVYGNLRK